MYSGPEKRTRSECPVCYLTHDDEIHEATLRIHEWFFGQVTRNFVDDSEFAAELQPERSPADACLKFACNRFSPARLSQ